VDFSNLKRSKVVCATTASIFSVLSMCVVGWMIRAKSKRDAAGAVGTYEGAEEFVALPAGGFEVGGFEGFAVAPGAAFGMADAVVNPPGAVVALLGICFFT
jgi:hypothetical protein